MSPTEDERRLRSVMVKNRRLAYLNDLIGDGKYFSEEAMREREPYLHHEFVGKFQDQSARGVARPGERWSETLMRRCGEAALVQKIREEQIRLGVDEREWVGGELNQRQEEEEEEEEVEEEEEEEEEERNEEMKSVGVGRGSSGVCSSEIPSGNTCSQLSGAAPNVGETVSAEEMGHTMDRFTYMMHQKFLVGEDDQHFDYSKIDDDMTLDDHWLGEVSRDAEGKYFAEDEDMEELH